MFSLHSIQHDELIDEYKKNMTQEPETRLQPQRMRFVDGDNDDYRRYQALCRGDDLRVSAANDDSSQLIRSTCDTHTPLTDFSSRGLRGCRLRRKPSISSATTPPTTAIRG